MGPVLEPRLKLLLDQQAAEARAVDEQVARNPRAVGEHDRVDVAAFAVALDRDDPAFLADDAALLGKTAQELRVEARVEMEGVGHRRQRTVRRRLQVGEAVGRDRQRVKHVMAERLGNPELQCRAANNDGTGRHRARCPTSPNAWT